MILYKKIPFNLGDTQIKVNIEVYSRHGSKSPALWIVIYKGKRYTPYAQRLTGLSIGSTGMLVMLYSGTDIASLVYSPNPFLSSLPKDLDLSGKFIPIPVYYDKKIAF